MELNFTEIQDYIKEEEIKDKKYVSLNGKSRFEVDGKGNIVNMVISNMKDKYKVQLRAEDFIKYEVCRREQYKKKMLPSKEEMSGMDMFDLEDDYKENKGKDFQVMSKFDTTHLKDNGIKGKIEKLNKGLTFEELVETMIFPRVIQNELYLERKQCLDAQKKITSHIKKRHKGEDIITKIDIATDLIGIANTSK